MPNNYQIVLFRSEGIGIQVQGFYRKSKELALEFHQYVTDSHQSKWSLLIDSDGEVIAKLLGKKEEEENAL